MKTIIFLNQKGGVAKTTSTINIASQLAKMGHKTLMIDFDPQASLTIISGFQDPSEFDGHNIKELLQPTNPSNPIQIEECIIPVKCNENLFLIPSDISLAMTEMYLHLQLRGEKTLGRIIKTLPSDFEYVCIDCPPSFGMLSMNAIAASDLIIGCADPAYQAIRALQHMIASVENISSLLEKDLIFGGLIIGRIGRGNDVDDCLDILRNNYDVLGEIKSLVSTTDGEVSGIPVSILRPSSINAREFYSITQKIVNMINEESEAIA